MKGALGFTFTVDGKEERKKGSPYRLIGCCERESGSCLSERDYIHGTPCALSYEDGLFVFARVALPRPSPFTRTQRASLPLISE